MSQDEINFSVIIPVANGENAWRDLLTDLEFLAPEDEILIVSPDSAPRDFSIYQNLFNIKWINTELGRARQLNMGARLSQNNFLWFVHCDSRISKESFELLKKNLINNPKNLYYFDLKFSNDGPPFMIINEWGVYIRSRLLKMPFGDQAFSLMKESFQRIGPFDERCLYGEDHLFVWNARIKKISVVSVKSSIVTSARRYQKKGWGKTTLNHLWKTFYQAFPKFLELVRSR